MKLGPDRQEGMRERREGGGQLIPGCGGPAVLAPRADPPRRRTWVRRGWSRDWPWRPTRLRDKFRSQRDPGRIRFVSATKRLIDLGLVRPKWPEWPRAGRLGLTEPFGRHRKRLRLCDRWLDRGGVPGPDRSERDPPGRIDRSGIHRSGSDGAWSPGAVDRSGVHRGRSTGSGSTERDPQGGIDGNRNGIDRAGRSERIAGADRPEPDPRSGSTEPGQPGRRPERGPPGPIHRERVDGAGPPGPYPPERVDRSRIHRGGIDGTGAGSTGRIPEREPPCRIDRSGRTERGSTGAGSTGAGSTGAGRRADSPARIDRSGPPARVDRSRIHRGGIDGNRSGSRGGSTGAGSPERDPPEPDPPERVDRSRITGRYRRNRAGSTGAGSTGAGSRDGVHGACSAGCGLDGAARRGSSVPPAGSHRRGPPRPVPRLQWIGSHGASGSAVCAEAPAGSKTTRR